MSRDIVIDENSSWDWNSGDATNKPLMSYDIDEESSEHEKIPINDTPTIVEVKDDNRVEVKVDNLEGGTSRSQRPQRTIVLLTRLDDCEMGGDDEVTPDEDLVHFALLAGAELINYSEAFKDKQWKEVMV